MKNKNEGKKNIQIDDDVYLKLKEMSVKIGMPIRHYLHEIINEKVNGQSNAIVIIQRKRSGFLPL